jgi:F0F1-type ATP synthase assembly protein I
MTDDGHSSQPARSGAEQEQERGRLEESRAWNIPSYLLAGVLGFGGIGYLIDRLIGTNFIVAIGIVGGMALAIYYVWFRYGKS